MKINKVNNKQLRVFWCQTHDAFSSFGGERCALKRAKIKRGDCSLFKVYADLSENKHHTNINKSEEKGANE